jgi:hypothetical protein
MGCLYFTRTVAVNLSLHWAFITSVSNTFIPDLLDDLQLTTFLGMILLCERRPTLSLR